MATTTKIKGATVTTKTGKEIIDGTIEERITKLENKLDSIVGLDSTNRIEKDIDRMGDCYDDLHDQVAGLENIIKKIRARMGI